MLKKLFTIFLALLIGVQPLAANAADLGGAFSSLLGSGSTATANGPGRYQSGARNSFTAGGLEVRVPRGANNPSLFSVTPPRIIAGCNGISATFGGFSFITGQEFQMMLKQIASGATLGFVAMLTLKTLCPQCEAVVQFLKTAAQAAAKLSRDSCAMGEQLAATMMKEWGMGGSAGDSQSVCGTTISSTNGSKDFLESINGACNSITKAVDALIKDSPKSPECQANPTGDKCKAEERAIMCKVGSGNVTWQRLAAFDQGGVADSDANYKRRLLLMNLMGAQLAAGEKEGTSVGCETDGGDPKIVDNVNKADYCVPKLEPRQTLGLFMCGAPLAGNAVYSEDGAVPAQVTKYCSYYYNDMGSSPGAGSVSKTKIYVCDRNDRVKCSYLKLTEAGDLFQGEGFLVSIHRLLRKGVEAVRKNEPMPANVIQLMQVAPVPLYQAINAAAVYPAAADELMDSLAALVAEQFAIALFDESLRMGGRSSANTCLNQESASRILATVAEMSARAGERTKTIGQNMAAQQLLNEQIRQINLTIQRQVLNQDLLANGQFSQSLNKALAPSAPATSTSSN